MNKSDKDRERISKKIINLMIREGCDTSAACEIALLVYWTRFRSAGAPQDEVLEWATKQMQHYETSVQRAQAQLQ